MATTSFAGGIRASYKGFWRQISAARARGEHELRRRFIETVIEKGLKFPKECIHIEKDQTDIWLADIPPSGKSRSKMVPTVVIETKDFQTVDDNRLIQSKAQALSYAVPSATKYVGLTNFKRFYIWRIDKTPEQVCDTNLYIQTFTKPFQETLTQLACIQYEEVSRVYDDFSRSQQLDISNPEVFKKFTQVAKSRILDAYLLPRLGFLASYLHSRYQEFEDKAKPISQLIRHDKERELDYKRQLKQLEEHYSDARKFYDYFCQWLERVYPTGVKRPKPQPTLDRFALETAYTLFARALLVRVAEDKGLLQPKLHDGSLTSLIGTISAASEAYKLILQHAFRDASTVLKRLFTEDVYDWYDRTDGALNEGMKKTLWHMNQIVFTNIRGDVFKYIYQEHMDADERKRFGEFYTPDEVVNYLLDKVRYSEKLDLRQTRLLDPGCGSGTFLVEAFSRLMTSLKGRVPLLDSMTYVGQPYGREIPLTKLNDSLFGIFGFDILPFAEHLSQINLLSYLIDHINEIKKTTPDFKFDQLWVFRTDTLQPANPGLFPSSQIDSNDIKGLHFDYVVGNPPYVCITNLKDVKRTIEQFMKQKYPYIFGKNSAVSTKFYRTDIYLPFIAFSISWLKPKARMGMIVSGKFLSTMNGQWLRKFILNECIIEQIVDLMRVKVFAQDVYPILLILQRKEKQESVIDYKIDVKIILKDDIKMLARPLDANIISSKDYLRKTDYLSYEIPANYFENPRTVFEIYDSSLLKPIRDKIENAQGKIELDKVLDIRQGVIRGGKEKWERCLENLRLAYQKSDLQFGNDFQVAKRQRDKLPIEIRQKCVPLVDGQTFGEFYPEWQGLYLYYDRGFLTAPRQEGIFDVSPKLFVGYITKYLKASYDVNSIYVANDTYIGLLRTEQASESGISLLYLLGLLNSAVLDFYYKLRHPEILRGGWFKRYDYVLAEMPIAKPEEKQRKSIEALVYSETDKNPGLVQLRKMIIEAQTSLGNPKDLLGHTSAKIVDFFNSKLITSEIQLKDIPLRHAKALGNTVLLAKDSSIICSSERASKFIARLINHCLKEVETVTPKDLLKEVMLPADEQELLRVLEEISMLEKRLRKLRLKYAKKKSQLDIEVAKIYGVEEHIELIKRVREVLTEPLESRL